MHLPDAIFLGGLKSARRVFHNCNIAIYIIGVWKTRRMVCTPGVEPHGRKLAGVQKDVSASIVTLLLSPVENVHRAFKDLLFFSILRAFGVPLFPKRFHFAAVVLLLALCGTV